MPEILGCIRAQHDRTATIFRTNAAFDKLHDACQLERRQQQGNTSIGENNNLNIVIRDEANMKRRTNVKDYFSPTFLEALEVKSNNSTYTIHSVVLKNRHA